METTEPKAEQVSSMMEKPSYNPETRVLTIVFKKGGAIYDYPDFDPLDAEAFLLEPSWGKAFHSHKALFANGVKRAPAPEAQP